MATSLDTFTSEEVQQIQRAVTDVVFGAIASEPGGPVSVISEVIGGGRGLADSLKETHSELLDQIFKSSADGQEVQLDADALSTRVGREAIMAKGVESAVAAVGTIRAKAEPDEAAALAQTLIATAEHAVAATKKGGFLGIGGERITQNEAAYVRRLTEALVRQLTEDLPSPRASR